MNQNKNKTIKSKWQSWSTPKEYTSGEHKHTFHVYLSVAEEILACSQNPTQSPFHFQLDHLSIPVIRQKKTSSQNRHCRIFFFHRIAEFLKSMVSPTEADNALIISSSFLHILIIVLEFTVVCFQSLCNRTLPYWSLKSYKLEEFIFFSKVSTKYVFTWTTEGYSDIIMESFLQASLGWGRRCQSSSVM